MKIKSIIIILILILVLVIFPLQAQADTYGFFTYYSNGDGTCKISGYTGTQTTITIPASINGLTVTEISQNAFYNKDLVSVNLPK